MFKSQGGQGLRGSDVGSGKGEYQGCLCPSPLYGVRGLDFPCAKIGGSKSIVLGTRLRDIRSPNQYKIIRASCGKVESDIQQIVKGT